MSSSFLPTYLPKLSLKRRACCQVTHSSPEKSCFYIKDDFLIIVFERMVPQIPAFFSSGRGYTVVRGLCVAGATSYSRLYYMLAFPPLFAAVFSGAWWDNQLEQNAHAISGTPVEFHSAWISSGHPSQPAILPRSSAPFCLCKIIFSCVWSRHKENIL